MRELVLEIRKRMKVSQEENRAKGVNLANNICRYSLNDDIVNKFI